MHAAQNFRVDPCSNRQDDIQMKRGMKLSLLIFFQVAKDVVDENKNTMLKPFFSV